MDGEDVLRDVDEDVAMDEETRLLEEEAERMRERLRSMRGREQAGSSEGQEQRDRSTRARRTDSGTGRRVVFDRSRSPLSPPVRGRQQL